MDSRFRGNDKVQRIQHSDPFGLGRWAMAYTVIQLKKLAEAGSLPADTDQFIAIHRVAARLGIGAVPAGFRCAATRRNGD
jgi:hypothetical protein